MWQSRGFLGETAPVSGNNDLGSDKDSMNMV